MTHTPSKAAEPDGEPDTLVWKLLGSVPIPYSGVDHLDFSADGSYEPPSRFVTWSDRVSRLTDSPCAPRPVGRNPTSFMATGSISVIDFATRKIVTTWPIGGSPDMGGISPDGTQIWVSGRDDRGCTSSTRARVSG